MRNFALLVSLFFAGPLAGAQVVYVDSHAQGANNGTSWSDAFVDLQSALAQTNMGEIWVAAGEYRPALVGQTSVSFVLKNQVALYGGFAGFES